MLSVSFNQPIIISAENLNSLLTLANTPAVVTPYVDAALAPAAPAKRVRGGKAAAPTGDKPKRTRATKAEMEARRAAAAAGGAPAGEASPPEADAAPAKEEAPPASDAAPVPDAPAKPKRDRRSAAKKAADAAAAAPKAPPAKKASAGKTSEAGAGKASKEPPKSAAPSEYAEGLLARFATLIDSDFAAASAMLAEFGVKRFSELKPEQHKAFDAKLTEAKV